MILGKLTDGLHIPSVCINNDCSLTLYILYSCTQISGSTWGRERRLFL